MEIVLETDRVPEMETDQENQVQENLTDQTDREMVTDQGNRIVRATDIDLEEESHHTGSLYMGDRDTDMVITRITTIITIIMVGIISIADGTGRSALWHLVQQQV